MTHVLQWIIASFWPSLHKVLTGASRTASVFTGAALASTGAASVSTGITTDRGSGAILASPWPWARRQPLFLQGRLQPPASGATSVSSGTASAATDAASARGQGAALASTGAVIVRDLGAAVASTGAVLAKHLGVALASTGATLAWGCLRNHWAVTVGPWPGAAHLGPSYH